MVIGGTEVKNRGAGRAKWKLRRKDILNVLMVVMFILFISPTLIVVNIALKTQQESIVTEFFVLPQKLQFVNFINIFKKSQIVGSFFNSVLISVSTVAFCTVVTSMASYIIARKKSIFSKGIYYFFLINFFVPGEAVLISVMQLMKFYHLYGYLPGLIILYTSGASAMAIYLFCAYIKSIPVELDEAAMIDGAGMMRFFWTILFPLMKPVVVTFSLIVGINIYNDFMTPLLFLKANSGRTVTLEIMNFVSAFASNYPMAFSGIIVASVPILIAFFTAQKYIISGLTAGVVKG
jgi:raffinose/stachyose/melibiose transport system permease protein